MLDQLIQMLQQQGQESVVNNAAVPNEHNNGVLQEASSSITNVLKNMVDNGQGDPIAAVANDNKCKVILQITLHRNFASTEQPPKELQLH